jgi:hypothetical protein
MCVKIAVGLDVTCNLLHGQQHFEGNCYVHVYGGSSFLRNVSILQQTARRHIPQHTYLCEKVKPHIKLCLYCTCRDLLLCT